MSSVGTQRSRRILAVSSGGGHWVELLRLRPAFEQADVTWVTVDQNYAADVPGERFKAVHDATRWNRLGLAWLAFRLLCLVLREWPDVVVSTGAAPGYLTVRIAKLLGRRTIWLDSVANADELSLSGQMAGKYADLWLTQWPHLAGPGGPQYHGRVF